MIWFFFILILVPSSLSLFCVVQTARNIRHLPCVVRVSGLKGVCMFAIDCIKANGTHLGTCIDKFYFGSCCQMKVKLKLLFIIIIIIIIIININYLMLVINRWKMHFTIQKLTTTALIQLFRHHMKQITSVKNRTFKFQPWHCHLPYSLSTQKQQQQNDHIFTTTRLMSLSAHLQRFHNTTRQLLIIP